MIFLMIFLIVFSQKLPRKKTLLITFLNLNLQKISDRSLFFISSLVEGLHILGLLLSEIFRISEILLIIRFTTTKLKNLEQPKPSNINIVRQANHKQNQKLLGFNVYNIRINVLRPISQKKPIQMVCLNQITGFYMNQIHFFLGYAFSKAGSMFLKISSV